MKRNECRATRRKQCPDCPDGYIWTKNGPTDAECTTCLGEAYIVVRDEDPVGELIKERDQWV